MTLLSSRDGAEEGLHWGEEIRLRIYDSGRAARFMTNGDSGGTGVTVEDLRRRVRAAEERFEKKGRETQAARERMVELVTALDGEREDRLDQIAGLEERLTVLTGENNELRGLLTELLGVVEKIGDDDGLAGLEAELRREAAEDDEEEDDDDDDEEDGSEAPALLATGAVAAVEVTEKVAVEAEGAVEGNGAEVAETGPTDEQAAGLGAAVPATEVADEAADDEALVLEEEPAGTTEEHAEVAPEPSSEETPEKSDSETDQLDRILRSIRRITS